MNRMRLAFVIKPSHQFLANPDSHVNPRINNSAAQLARLRFGLVRIAIGGEVLPTQGKVPCTMRCLSPSLSLSLSPPLEALNKSVSPPSSTPVQFPVGLCDIVKHSSVRKRT
ncbi:unnamed protein product [Hydatigera taeniaeformis]|uniref:Uncharacterized protein n=1 Tax=Hydatigena taeniaeformis TaxID=6205 RepID=A0A0R3X4Z3_HYDTA|nr:unnamed protein product [Hydatigera taeniaeformis]